MALAPNARLRAAAEIFELQMKRRRLLATIALFVLFELSMIGTEPFMTTTLSATSTQGDLLRQVLLVGTLGLLLFAPANARPPMPVPVSLVVLLGYCLLSCTWALDPMISLRRLAFTALVILILVRAIGDLGAVRTLNVIRSWLVILLLINYLTVLFTPYGTHTMTVDEVEDLIGDWRGILSHKNTTGAVTAFTVLFFAFDRSRLPRAGTAIVLAASLFFLAMTNSKTSIAMLAIAGAAGWVMYWYNPRHRSLVVPVAIMATVGFGSLAAMYLGVIQNMLDDPASFTGRAQIWPLLLEYARDHLWTGAGYMSFWQIGNASPIWAMTNNWIASTQGHGHNGYLDILVTLGLPGLVLTIAVVFVWPTIKLLFSTEISRERRSLIVALMVFALGHNMMESTLLDRVSPVQIFLMVAIILIHRLSSQSAGAHQAIRQRLVKLTHRQRNAPSPSQHPVQPRPLPVASGSRVDAEDSPA